MRKNLTIWLLLSWSLLVLFNGCATTPKEVIRYENVKANTIVVFDGVTSWEYDLDWWMVVKRDTYRQVWDMVTDKDEQLHECLEREKAKTN